MHVLRNTFAAVALSGLLWPGAGQLYNRQRVKGAILIVLSALSAAAFLAIAGSQVFALLNAHPLSQDPEAILLLADELAQAQGTRLRLAALVMTGTWLFSVVDAYFGARPAADSKISR